MNGPLGRGVYVTLLVALPGCGDSGDGPSSSAEVGFTVRDSAGIRITEASDSVWPEETRWRLAEAPDLAIGSVDGSAPGTDFSAINAVVSVGDHVAVLDRQGQEVRLFGPDGAFIRSFGGRGDGPLEFRSIGRIDGVDGVAIRVAGYRSRKVVEFPLDGSNPGVYPLPPLDWNGRTTRVTGWGRDGGVVLRASSPRASDWRLEGDLGTLADDWFLFSSAGDSLAHIGSLPATRVYDRPGGSGPIMFGARSATAVTAVALIHGFPHRAFEFRRIPLRTSSDVPTSIVRLRVPPTPMPAGMDERYVAFEEARALEQGVSLAQFDEVRGRFEAVEVADTVPFFRDLLAAPDGSVWLNRWPDPSSVPDDELMNLDEIESPDWVVVDPTGRWLGTVVMPLGFTPHEVGTDAVLGVRTGEFDVPFVERYRIIR